MGALHESEKLRLGLLVLLSNMGWVAFSLGRVNLECDRIGFVYR